MLAIFIAVESDTQWARAKRSLLNTTQFIEFISMFVSWLVLPVRSRETFFFRLPIKLSKREGMIQPLG